MLACRSIAHEWACSRSQLINVNATGKAEFAESGNFADDQRACGINRRRSSGDSSLGGTVMLGGRARDPVDLPLMALSVVVLPGSDDEAVIRWNRRISL
jgi:hypothetical protein